MKLRFKELFYYGPSSMEWAILCIFSTGIFVCSILGGYILVLILPFMYYSTLGIVLFVFDYLKPSLKKSLNWHGVVWLLLLAIISWSGLAYGILKRVNGLW